MASRSWNRVELMGNLTRDPELRYTPNGAAVCTFGMATNRSYVVDGERREDVDFHRLVSWNKLAELCNQLLKKGSRVFISGRLQYREWETPEGQKRREAEIVIEDMIQLTPRSGALTEEEAPAEEAPVAEAAPANEKTSSKAKETKQAASSTANPVKPEPADETAPSKPNEDVAPDDLPF